jgi:hypothetical protein
MTTERRPLAEACPLRRPPATIRAAVPPLTPRSLGCAADGLAGGAALSLLLSLVFTVLAATAPPRGAGGGDDGTVAGEPAAGGVEDTADGGGDGDGDGGRGGLFSGLRGLLDGDGPPDPGFRGGLPVGLYLMSKYWYATGSLEKAAWYFTDDGRLYVDPASFAEEDLARHDGRGGTVSGDGDEMVVAWSHGPVSKGPVERDGDHFGFDTGLYAPAQPFAASSQVVGRWEGGTSLSFSGSYAASSRTLDLRGDGTFGWDAAAFLSTASAESEASAGSTGSVTGTWELDGYSLQLTDSTGKVVRGIAFPFDDEATPVFPDRFYFSGVLYAKLEG